MDTYVPTGGGVSSKVDSSTRNSGSFGSDDLGAIVADIGSFAARIGFAGDDCPKAYFPSLVGLTNGNSSSSAATSSGAAPTAVKETRFDLHNFHPHMRIGSVTKDGVIDDWEAFEKLWEYANKTFLKANFAESPVFMAEKPYTPSSTRRKLTEVMFERFSAPAFFLSKDSVLSCYSCGKTSGLVVDVGSLGSTISGVIDGWVDPKSIVRGRIGGRLLDAYVLSLIKQVDPLPLFRLIKTVTPEKRIAVSKNPNIINVHPTYDALMKLDIGRDLKESVLRVSDTPITASDPRYVNIPLVPYELPDGNIVDLGIERFQPAEYLFDPSYFDPTRFEPNLLAQLGADFASPSYQTVSESVPQMAGLHAMVVDSLFKCEPENYNSLLSNLVVTGGTSSIEGLPDRIKYDVETKLHLTLPNLRVKVTSVNPNSRALSAWIGGSIVASLGSSHEMWVTRKEYQEYGSNIIDRKCP